MTLNWKVIGNDWAVIVKIAARAAALSKRFGPDYRYPQDKALMDLAACHANGCTLRLDELLAANDGDFGHDVFGIRRHIDRDTGKLNDCFVPRYAAPVKEAN